jgi:hypothetical protein
LARGQIDFWLEEQTKFFTLDGVAQPSLDQHAILGFLVHARGKELEIITPQLLRSGHCGVGVFDEFIDAGGVIINDVPTYRIDHMPYGGVKASGLGREGIKYAIEDMTEPRLMVFNRLESQKVSLD